MHCAGEQQTHTNTARLHAQRLAAIRAGLRGTLPDAQSAASSAPLKGTSPASEGPKEAHDAATPVKYPSSRGSSDGDIRSGNTAARRIGRDPRPRAERAQQTAAAGAQTQSADPGGAPGGARPQAGLKGRAVSSPPISPSKLQRASVPPWQRRAQQTAASRESSSPSLAGPSGSLSRMGGGTSALGLLANQRMPRRSCSPKVGGPPPVRRTGPYSHSSGHRGGGRGKHGGPRSVPARVSAVWR